MSEIEIPEVLERNAQCPICHKYYHNIDVWNNPVPSRKNKRKEESLCQCQKGIAAREYRRQWRMDRKDEDEKREARKAEILSMPERNREYWQRIREKEVKRKNGVSTTSA